ncbi:MAG: hypothetical protein CMF77_05800 [Candidatus Marinimicrobia bacterium]|nr:hypothetical protein [Candidatus Neomarinimicrobiota bacterium]
MTNRISPVEEQILKEGFDTLTQTGIRSFTVESLAARLHMSKKTIYKFFPTKETLLEKTVSFVTRRIEAKFQDVISSDENAVVKFNRVMDIIPDQMRRFQIERILELKSRYPSIWRKVEEFRLARRDNFCTILSEAQEQGFLRADIDVQVAATLYMNMVNSTFQPEFFINNNLAPVDTVKTFVSMIVEGLFTEDGVRAARSDRAEQER